jgi:hypothetical protein
MMIVLKRVKKHRKLRLIVVETVSLNETELAIMVGKTESMSCGPTYKMLE